MDNSLRAAPGEARAPAVATGPAPLSVAVRQSCCASIWWPEDANTRMLLTGCSFSNGQVNHGVSSLNSGSSRISGEQMQPIDSSAHLVVCSRLQGAGGCRCTRTSLANCLGAWEGDQLGTVGRVARDRQRGEKPEIWIEPCPDNQHAVDAAAVARSSGRSMTRPSGRFATCRLSTPTRVCRCSVFARSALTAGRGVEQLDRCYAWARFTRRRSCRPDSRPNSTSCTWKRSNTCTKSTCNARWSRPICRRSR